MSKIDQLIQEYCPEGVEFSRLDDLCEIKVGGDTPKKYQKGQMQPSEEFPYPIYSNGTETYGYSDSYKIDNQAVTISSIGNVGWVAFRDAFFTPIIRLKVLIPNDTRILDTKYLYYIMSIQSIVGTNSSLSSINANDVKKLKIPVPPVEVQKEIVNILDKFTQLEAELSAELDSRNKQYEYYRKQLLLTDESREGTRHLTLGDIGKVSMCKRIFKDQTSSVGDIPFYKIGTFGKAPDSFISQEVYDEYRRKYSFPKKGDILLSASGTIGRTVVYDGEDAYFQDSNIIWLDNDERIVTNPFLFHIYKIVKWQTEGGTIQRLYNDNLKKIKITVPSIDEQNRIVSILNKFETLVNGISSGLPAEITARRQQYEYYRAKLLTFQELPV